MLVKIIHSPADNKKFVTLLKLAAELTPRKSLISACKAQ